MGINRERIAKTTGGMSRRQLVLGAASAGGAAMTEGSLVRGVSAALAQDATPVAAGMPDPRMQEVLDGLASLNQIPIETQSPFNARQLPLPADAVRSLLSQRGEPAQGLVGAVDHRVIPTPNGDLIGRVYTPGGDGPSFPVLVYFHGGRVIANLDTYDASCRALTKTFGTSGTAAATPSA